MDVEKLFKTEDVITVLRRIMSNGDPGGYMVHIRHELAVALWNDRKYRRWSKKLIEDFKRRNRGEFTEEEKREQKERMEKAFEFFRQKSAAIEKKL